MNRNRKYLLLGVLIISLLAFHTVIWYDLPDEEIEVTKNNNIPESKRSKEVINKTKLHLQKKLKEKSLKLGSPVFIRIFKKSKELELWIKQGKIFQLFKVYEICYYSGNLGPKLKSGDRQSPEGFYFVTPGQLNPFSSYHLSFNIGYPNKYDKYHKRTGNLIMVHGNCVSIGCFAMTDPFIEEIYTIVALALSKGQKYFRVHIFPYRMTDENMLKYKDSKWKSFWENIKKGYDYFEEKKIPPNVEIEKGKYVFTDD